MKASIDILTGEMVMHDHFQSQLIIKGVRARTDTGNIIPETHTVTAITIKVHGVNSMTPSIQWSSNSQSLWNVLVPAGEMSTRAINQNLPAPGMYGSKQGLIIDCSGAGWQGQTMDLSITLSKPF